VKCEDCTRFESCDIIREIRKLRYELHKAKNNVQTELFQSVRELEDRYKEEQIKLRNRRLELRRKQGNCFRSRLFSQYLGYSCFKPKKQDKEDKDAKNNQNQVLDSYF